MASYASLGDVILAEPEALIGLRSRVIKETTQQDLPKDSKLLNFCSSMVSLIKLYTVIKCGIQSADCSLLLEQKNLNVSVPDMHDLNSVTEFLYSLRNRGSKYGLERMEALAKSIANPEKRFSSIHVAGTNGKGSVCAMLESIYRSNG